MKIDRNDMESELQRQQNAWAQLKAQLMDQDHLDEDGYPTEAALELIRRWHWGDTAGLIEFICGLWHMRSWGWSEKDASDLPPDDPDHQPEGGQLIFAATGGWSGNESLIGAFQQNHMAWHLAWVQSRRGGHFIFRPYHFASDA